MSFSVADVMVVSDGGFVLCSLPFRAGLFTAGAVFNIGYPIDRIIYSGG
jgi:hypothetical protein